MRHLILRSCPLIPVALAALFHGSVTAAPPTFPAKIELGEIGTPEEGKAYLRWFSEAGKMYQLQQLLVEDVPTDIDFPIPKELVPWTNVGTPWYGTGSDVRMHVYDIPDTPAATSGAPIAGPVLQFVILQLQPLSDGTGTVVSWGGFRRVYPRTGDPGFARVGTIPTPNLDLLIMPSPDALTPETGVDLTHPPLSEWTQAALDQWSEIATVMPDILAGNGADGAGGFEGGGEAAPPPPAGQNIARLWRVQEMWPDTDGDGLYDWEELGGIALWYSNPFSIDSDGDGWTDGIEQQYSSSANDSSSQPQPSPSDWFPPPPPTDPFVPPQTSGLEYVGLFQQLRWMKNDWQHIAYSNPEIPAESLTSIWGYLNPVVDPSTDVFSDFRNEFTPLYLSYIGSTPFRDSTNANSWQGGPSGQTGFAFYEFDSSSSDQYTFTTHRLTLRQTALRLASRRYDPETDVSEFIPIPRISSRSYIRTIERGPAYLETGPTTIELHPEDPLEEFTIPATDHISSSEVRLEPLPEPDLNVIEHLDPVTIYAGGANRVEVPMNPGWGHFFLNQFWDDRFPERGRTFRIIMPLRVLESEPPSMDHLRVNVWTTDRNGGVRDPSNEVRFDRNGTGYEFSSPASIITADTEDDAFNGHLTNGVDEDPEYDDEAIRDSSHYGELGGTLHAQIVAGQGVPRWTFTFPIEPPKARMEARMVVVEKQVIISLDNPNYQQELDDNNARVVEAERQMKIATEIYAQAGIDLNWGSGVHIKAPKATSKPPSRPSWPTMKYRSIPTVESCKAHLERFHPTVRPARY